MSNVRFENDGTTNVNGITVNTPYETDKKDQGLTMGDFLQLMIAEMKNQDFMGGGEGGGSSQSANASNYITQMAQMSTMQQMEQLAYYSKSNYAMSMVGKQVTVATLGIGGKVNKETGMVEKVTLDNNEYLVYVNGKGYKLSEIMNVGVPGAEDSDALGDLGKQSLVIMDKKEDSLRVRWDAPKIPNEDEKKIVYKVYYSKDNDKMDTIEEIEKNGKLAGSSEKLEGDERHYCSIDELEPGATYYISVVAESPSGRKYAYKTSQVKM